MRDTGIILFYKLPVLQGHEKLEYFLVSMILTFTGFSMLLFVLLMYSRMRKLYLEQQTRLAEPEFEGLIVKYLFEEVELHELMGSPAIKKALQRKWMRSVLLNEMLKLHGNFSGEYADKLELFYVESGLIATSLEKLKSRKWHVKCKGIKELTQMHSLSAFSKILRYTNSKNEILRREAQLSVLKLEGFKGLVFLNGYHHALTEWEQLNFIAILKKMEQKNVPPFSTWLSSSNPSLQVFALRLIIEFNQAESAQSVLHCLQSGSEEIKKLAIEVLCSLHAIEYANEVAALYNSGSHSLNLLVLDTLGKMGSTAHIDFLVRELSTNDFDTRMHALRALIELTGGTEIIAEKNIQPDEELNRIINHVNDSRIHV